MLSTSLGPHARVAFIGTRSFHALPVSVQRLFIQAAEVLAARRLTIVTGAAFGADQVAADAALSLGGSVHLVLPWRSYEHKWVRSVQAHHRDRVTLEIYDPTLNRAWAESVRVYHPAPARLSRGAFALHARNFGIVATAVAVIAAAKDAAQHGGTGQGVRVARGLGIPVLDLWNPDDWSLLQQEMCAS